MKTEGDGATRLIELLRGPKRQESTLTTAEVTNLNPLAIRLPGYRDDIPEEALVIAEELKDYTRTINFNGGSVSGSISTGGSLTSLNITNGTLTIKSPLQVGDSVICAVVDDGQTIYVLAREAN